ncbi:MAG: DUF507 family protein [Myxococcales bacterium]|nr:DUF507 family protein [Myxococcales bacterium]USN51822.1 MAG: DUF507 family protein [Myxococcales bacterium]
MALYRKIIPKIARDVIRTLSTQEAIEVDESRMSEAELDLAAVMVGYVDTEEEISREAADTLVRLGMPRERFQQLKQRFAERRNVKIGEEGLEYLLNQLLEALFQSKNIEEIYAQDADLRKTIKECMNKSIQVSEEVEQEARSRLKNIKEGTPEWDIEYPRMIAQVKRQKGL